jgi:hypothetical protein
MVDTGELLEKGLYLKIRHPELVEGTLTISFRRKSFKGIGRDPSTSSG